MLENLVIYIAPLLSSLRLSAAAAVDVSGPGETANNNRYNLSESEKFLAELKFGNPQQKQSAYNEEASLKAPQHTSLLDKQTFVILESSNNTYTDRTVYVKRGGDSEIPCFENMEMKGYLKSLRYEWLDSSGVDVKKSKSKEPRIAIDERFQLHVNDAQPEDTGRYTCVIIAGFMDKPAVITITNAVSLNVYITPDLALEFPFLFDSTKCDEQRDTLQMTKIKNLLCPGSPCVFEFAKTCVVEPWLNHNMPYVPHAMLLIVATKFADPEYKTPDCPHDCIMGNKFDHIVANLDFVRKAIEMIPNTTELTFLSSLTMRRKKLIYSCDAGYSLYQEHCVPCFPGTYNSKRRLNFCHPCPVNTYQQFPGTHNCLQCPSDKVTRGLKKASIKDCVKKHIDVFRFRHEFFILSCVLGMFLLLAIFIYISRNWDTLKLKLTWLKPQPEYSKLLMASQKLEKSKEQPSATASAAVSAKSSKQQIQSITPAMTETKKTKEQTTSDKASTGTELPTTPKPVRSMTTTTMQSSMPPWSTRTNESTFPALPQTIPQNAPVATEIPQTPATPGLDTNPKPLKPALRVVPSQSLRPSLSTHLPPALPPPPAPLPALPPELPPALPPALPQVVPSVLPPAVPVQKSKSQIVTAQTSMATLATTARSSP